MASIAAAAARSAAARAAAARHVASDIGRFSPLFPLRGFAAGTTLPAAWTRSHAATPPVTRLLRHGLATIHHHDDDDDDGCFYNVDPATTFKHGEEDLASEEAMWALYERWCVFHNVKRDHDDMIRRFDGFKDKARTIYEFNKSGASFTMQLGKTCDMTAEEREKYFRAPFRGRWLPEKV